MSMLTQEYASCTRYTWHLKCAGLGLIVIALQFFSLTVTLCSSSLLWNPLSKGCLLTVQQTDQLKIVKFFVQKYSAVIMQ